MRKEDSDAEPFLTLLTFSLSFPLVQSSRLTGIAHHTLMTNHPKLASFPVYVKPILSRHWILFKLCIYLILCILLLLIANVNTYLLQFTRPFNNPECRTRNTSRAVPREGQTRPIESVESPIERGRVARPAASPVRANAEETATRSIGIRRPEKTLKGTNGLSLHD